MKQISDFIDPAGFVVTREADVSSRAGNSAQHTAMFHLFTISLYSQQIYVNLSSLYIILGQWKKLIAQGEFRLHWNIHYWPGMSGHGSRDNLLAWVCLLRVTKQYKELFVLMLKIVLRGGFLWNTKNIGSDDVNKKYLKIGGIKIPAPIPDWCGITMWFLVFRFKWNPFNLIGDLYLWLCMWIQVRRTRKDMDDTGDHLNIINPAEACRLISTNFVSLKSLRWYKSTGIPQHAVRDYFKWDWAAPIDVYATEVIGKRWP